MNDDKIFHLGKLETPLTPREIEDGDTLFSFVFSDGTEVLRIDAFGMASVLAPDGKYYQMDGTPLAEAVNAGKAHAAKRANT